MNKMIETTAKVLAGVGALNIGLDRFANIDVLSYVPAGMFTTVVIAAVAASGAWVLYLTYQKKI